jgi:alpha-glucoside transport system substrate-binding protein
MGGPFYSGRAWRFAVLTTVLLLAACSSNNNANNKSATNNSGAAPPSAANATQAGTGTPLTGPTVGQGNPQAAALAAAGGKKIGGSVSVIGSWGGEEQDSFMAMVKPFEDATGVTVNYTGTRDLAAELTTRVQGGNPPDLAGLPGPGTMAQFARQGKLVDLDNVLDMSAMKDQYPQSWLQLGQVDGKQIGIFIKASLKGPIWFDPKTFNQVSGGTMPKTWDELMSLSNKIAQTGTTPWCMGFESGASSGWPGADWLQDIMLRQYGPDVYDQWYQGTLPWTSNQVESTPMFANPPKCYMVHEGDFITGFITTNNPGLKPGTDFNYFMFPDINNQYTGSAQVAGDLFGMFKDTPQARALMKYLTTPEAQSIWVKRGGALSPNKKVTLDVYPDQIAKEEAQVITSAKIVRFSADDLMPTAMENEFWKAILDYLQNPSNLDSILANLDKVRLQTYPAATPTPAGR